MNGVIPSQQCTNLQAFRLQCSESLVESTSFENFEAPKDVIKAFEKLGGIAERNKILRGINNEDFSKPSFFGDQICRKYRKYGLFPQKTMYLGNDKTGSMIPRKAFDQPIFVYHYGKSLINNVHEPKHEYTLKLKNALNVHVAGIKNSYAYVRDKSGQTVLRIDNPMHLNNETEQIQERIEIGGEDNPDESSNIELREGEFFYCTPSSQYKIQVTLDMASTNMLIEKAKIYKNEGRIEVIVLFDGHFMATGQFNTEKSKWVCELTELPGTYGTSDFEVSPDHKSMIRTCNVQATWMVEKKGPSGEQVKAEQLKLEEVLNSLKSVQIDCEKRGNHIHKPTLIDTLCPNLHALNHLCKSLEDGSLCPNVLPSSWSSRERIVYLVYTQSTELLPEIKCTKPDRCLTIRIFLKTASKYSQKTVRGLRKDDFIELCLQLRLACRALYYVLTVDAEFPEEGVINQISMMSNFRELYTRSLDVVEVHGHVTHINSDLVECIVEVMASRATPAKCGRLLSMDGSAPKIVLKVMKKYAWLVMFGINPLAPSVEFLESFLEWLDKTLYDQYKLRDESASIAVAESLFREPQLPMNRIKMGPVREENAEPTSESGHSGTPKKRDLVREFISMSRDSSQSREGSVHPFLNDSRPQEEPTRPKEAPPMKWKRRTINHRNLKTDEALDEVCPAEFEDDPALVQHLSNTTIDEKTDE